MDTLIIEGTPKTPFVRMDAENGIIEIKGRSIPENSIEFYRVLVDWLEAYAKDPQPQTQVFLQFEYLNTHTSGKSILAVFNKLEAIHRINQGVTINWYYDEEDTLELGQDFESVLRLPFKMIEVKST